MTDLNLRWRLFAPARPARRIVYAPGLDADRGCPLPETGPALVAVSVPDWNRDLSPWPAPRAFRGGEDFAGGAKRYLDELLGRVVPEAERAFGPVASRGIMGCSLAGLFAVWALTQTGLFDCAASVSGSFWFDGFTDYLRANPPKRAPERVYLSLGEGEAKTKNARLAPVEARTCEVEALLRAAGAKIRFEMNPGGHFADGEARMGKALGYLRN